MGEVEFDIRAFLYETEVSYEDEYPDKEAVMKWMDDGIIYYIVHNVTIPPEQREAFKEWEEKFGKMLAEMMGHDHNEDLKRQLSVSPEHYCGYCRFKAMPLSGATFMNYVPVHRGITYGGRSKDGSYVYGFDCNHGGDKYNPDIKSTEWLKEQCLNMGRGIFAAAPYEMEYMKAKTEGQKAIIIDNYLKMMRESFDVDEEIGFGGLLGLLGGEL